MTRGDRVENADTGTSRAPDAVDQRCVGGTHVGLKPHRSALHPSCGRRAGPRSAVPRAQRSLVPSQPWTRSSRAYGLRSTAQTTRAAAVLTTDALSEQRSTAPPGRAFNRPGHCSQPPSTGKHHAYVDNKRSARSVVRVRADQRIGPIRGVPMNRQRVRGLRVVVELLELLARWRPGRTKAKL